MDRRRPLLLGTWFVLTGLGLASAIAALRPRSNARPTPATRENEVEITPFPPLPPPARREVEFALERVFGRALAGGDRAEDHWVGDFNGDGAEDLAARGRPRSGGLSALNHPYANWTLQDAEHPPDASEPVRPAVGREDELLAVIHGEGPRGWRQAEARQAYLVRNCASRPLEVRLLREIAPPAPGAVHSRIEVAVLLERGGASRFLAWTGGRYAWVTLRR